MARTVSVPQYVYNLSSALLEARSRLQQRMEALVLGYLKQKKLVASTLSTPLDMRSGDQGFARALHRVSRIVEREASKAAPYLKHLAVYGPDNELITYDRNALHIRMMGVILRPEGSRLPAILRRYCRYLTYLSVKNQLPFHVGAELRPALHSTSAEDVPEVNASYRLWVILRIVPLRPVDDSTGEGISQSSLELMQGDIAASGGNPNSVYRISSENPMGILWQARPTSNFFHHRDALVDINNGMPDGFLTPELVAFHIPDLVKCVVTLSRKLSYAASAFAIGTPKS